MLKVVLIKDENHWEEEVFIGRFVEDKRCFGVWPKHGQCYINFLKGCRGWF